MLLCVCTCMPRPSAIKVKSGKGQGGPSPHITVSSCLNWPTCTRQTDCRFWSSSVQFVTITWVCVPQILAHPLELLLPCWSIYMHQCITPGWQDRSMCVLPFPIQPPELLVIAGPQCVSYRRQSLTKPLSRFGSRKWWEWCVCVCAPCFHQIL